MIVTDRSRVLLLDTWYPLQKEKEKEKEDKTRGQGG